LPIIFCLNATDHVSNELHRPMFWAPPPDVRWWLRPTVRCHKCLGLRPELLGRSPKEKSD
jgi:hypothetical protein